MIAHDFGREVGFFQNGEVGCAGADGGNFAFAVDGAVAPNADNAGTGEIFGLGIDLEDAFGHFFGGADFTPGATVQPDDNGQWAGPFAEKRLTVDGAVCAIASEREGSIIRICNRVCLRRVDLQNEIIRASVSSVIYPTLVSVFLFARVGNAQSAGADLRQSVTGGFLYAVPIGSLNQENTVPGYTINYAYRPLNWLAFEGGFNQVIHPVGTIVELNNGIPFAANTNDQLYLVPFGTRFIWQPGQGRGRVSVGGGGAYLNHRYDQQAIANFLGSNTSGVGGQAVVSADYALSSSGRYRLGLTARLYYVPSTSKVAGYSYHETDRYFVPLIHASQAVNQTRHISRAEAVIDIHYGHVT